MTAEEHGVASEPADVGRERVWTERIWAGESVRLDRALAESGLARSRSHAAELIAAGRTRIDGRPATKAAEKVSGGAVLAAADLDHYVSRGAHKLVAGLDAFGVDPTGRLALDVGASTGGFTQVLLERGARAVLAIDVGHDQLSESLKGDPRIRLVEGLNAREMTPAGLAEATGEPGQPEIVVADLSFIALPLVLPAMVAVAAEAADFVLLIKPQFEVGRSGIRDGIVVDPARRERAVQGVLAAARALGLHTQGLIPSPIVGGAGNREYVVHFTRGRGPSDSGGDPTEWDARIRALTA